MIELFREEMSVGTDDIMNHDAPLGPIRAKPSTSSSIWPILSKENRGRCKSPNHSNQGRVVVTVFVPEFMATRPLASLISLFLQTLERQLRGSNRQSRPYWTMAL
jgi:hypothetical protein